MSEILCEKFHVVLVLATATGTLALQVATAGLLRHGMWWTSGKVEMAFHGQISS